MRGFDLTFRARSGGEYLPYLRRYLPRARKLMRTPLNELSIALVGDRVMSRLHDEYMQLNNPTDVLTFPLDLAGDGRAFSGEIVICVPEARRRCVGMGVAVQNELLLYAIHGMLHLSGFDDRTAGEFERMHRMEDRILRWLGVGPIFNPQASRKGSRR